MWPRTRKCGIKLNLTILFKALWFTVLMVITNTVLMVITILIPLMVIWFSNAQEGARLKLGKSAENL